MDPISYKTSSVNQTAVQKDWFLVDADEQPLGRLASQVATLLRGKHKPSFTPHVDCGDKVVIINAEKVQLTGKKWQQKTYISHTGYPGGQKTTTPRQVLEKHPTRLIEHAVKGMLPKNRLRNQLLQNLSVCTGTAHQHSAQNPQKITLKG
ncbi:MAG: 50S ribosomal protein L13 [Bacteroidota bacterium]